MAFSMSYDSKPPTQPKKSEKVEVSAGLHKAGANGSGGAAEQPTREAEALFRKPTPGRRVGCALRSQRRERAGSVLGALPGYIG